MTDVTVLLCANALCVRPASVFAVELFPAPVMPTTTITRRCHITTDEANHFEMGASPPPHTYVWVDVVVVYPIDCVLRAAGPPRTECVRCRQLCSEQISTIAARRGCGRGAQSRR